MKDKIIKEVMEWYWIKIDMKEILGNPILMKAQKRSDLWLAIELAIQKTRTETLKEIQDWMYLKPRTKEELFKFIKELKAKRS